MISQLHDPTFRGFASDNNSGVHPEVLEALALANGGHQRAYGADVYTEALGERVTEIFGERAEVYPVFNGTGANVVSLDLMTQRWDAVVCTRSAHINVDECGAPEKIAGTKLLPVDTSDGKLTPDLIDTLAWGFGDEHHAQPTVVSVTQSTELGTLYALDELRAVTEHAHGKGMRVHLDGARLANAAAALGVGLGEVTAGVGVDVVSFGGTKNGLLGAEAVIVLDPDAVSRPLFVRKLDGQLYSKMRFASVQLLTLLTDDLWQRSASHANVMARRLADEVRGIDGVRLTQEPQANAVFAILPPEVTTRLQERYPFYVWDEATGEVRWMCSFDTTEGDIEGFGAALREEIARA
ncbi:MAG: beta-eliminating lyase-related protein [Mobilicoccus sp.]|nr:beta-eliminating lyase-related protein [Mobilicoccus sp.]